jgi:hypothetical protein
MRDEEDRPVYRYKITDEAAGIAYEAADLSLAPLAFPNNTKATKVLVGELEASAEAFVEGWAIEADGFLEAVNYWAQQNADEITLAAVELSGGLER